MSSTAWRCYEEVAQYLLNRFAEHFNLGHVERKQRILGKSGTEWEIDAKGINHNETAFLVIECRRYNNRKIEQGYVGEVAYKIQDTGAQGGIIVSPLGFQEGAKKVAESSNIVHVTLDPHSTTTEYIMKFLNRIAIGVYERIDMTDCVDIRIRRLDADRDSSV